MTSKMSGVAKIPLPDRLELGHSATEKWKLFKQRWGNYVILTDLNSQDNVGKQKAIFLHRLGDEALQAYNSFQLVDDAAVNDIITAFDKFIIGEINVTYERFLFNKRKQSDNESVENFVADLQRLIKTCNYCDNCRESILRDKIILGISDPQLQKDLLRVRILTLKDCIDMCRSYERTTQQNQQLKPELVNKIKISTSKHKSACTFFFMLCCIDLGITILSPLKIIPIFSFMIYASSYYIHMLLMNCH